MLGLARDGLWGAAVGVRLEVGYSQQATQCCLAPRSSYRLIASCPNLLWFFRLQKSGQELPAQAWERRGWGV